LAEHRNATAPRSINKPSVKLLLVEDSPAEARLLQELLKSTILRQFSLVHAKRLGEAIALLTPSVPVLAEPCLFDLILLDLTLPDSQGLASLDALLHHVPRLPIVVLTNTNDDELAVEAVRHGAQDYLVKRQLNQDILVRSIGYAIERKQAAEALREANENLELRVQSRTAELKAANELLRHEIAWRQNIQDRLELAQQAGKIGSFDWNLQSQEITWSSELEALYGLSPGSFENQYAPWIQTLHDEDRDRIEQELLRATQSGQGLDTEFRIISPQKAVRSIAIKSNIFTDRDGRVQRMVGIHMDITEKKQLEAQFLRAQRLESLGTLASGIAHDLNNVLTPILAIAQFLPQKVPTCDGQTLNLLNMLETSARRGTDLIKQILSFARGLEDKRVMLQLKHLLLEVQQIIRQTLPKSIEVCVDLPSDLWVMSGDVTQLHQVFMNLCVNARDAMPCGGSLTIAAQNCLIDESFLQRHLDAKVGSYLAVKISDTGTGISPETMERMFDPFFTTKDIGKGTGLGLSAVLGIVKTHDGFIDVQSEMGKGSQFTVYLPANQSLIVNCREEGLDQFQGQQELILVVDDEPTICEVVKIILESYNYRALTALHASDAIALYAQHKNDISGVLMDMMMPHIDGATLTSILRESKPDLLSIAMSGLSDSENPAQVAKLGFQVLLSKPFTTKDLLQTLHDAVLHSSEGSNKIL
jgi:PAS domain S-box-containing protein